MVSVDDLDHVEYEERDGVGIWSISDFAAHFSSDEAVEGGETHYRELASRDDMTATIVALDNAAALGSDIRESLDHISEEWSQLADEVGIDRLAYVADGIISNTVKTATEADVETESFDSVD